MFKRFHYFFIFFLAPFFYSTAVYSQCLSLATTTVDATCHGGNDGEITLTITPGTAPDAQPPFDIELFFRNSAGQLTQLAFHDDVTFTTITFTPGNGSLNISGADDFGIPANAFIDPGSDYRIEVRSTGGTLTCRNKTAFVTVSQPTELTASVNTITPACSPGTGAIALDVSGGTPLTGGPPNYVYNWTGPTAIANTVEDPTNLDAGTYSVTIRDANYDSGNPGFCETTVSDIVVPGEIAITPGANPSVCSGTTSADLAYSDPIGSPDRYSIDFDATAEGQGFTDVVDVTLPSSPIVITVPGAAAVGTYNGTLTVRNIASGCASSSFPISVTIEPVPAITLGADPSVCAGSTSADLPYSATTGSPNEYSINFDGPAETAGFTDVASATLPLSPIVITVPGTATAGTYNGTLTVRNSATGCVSSSSSISVTINPVPTITLGADPAVCFGSTSANLSYSATTGTPDEYSINFDGAAETAGFTDVVDTALPASPIVIAVPGTAAAGTYNGTLTVRNSTTGCVSGSSPIKVTIEPIPTITLGADPAVCLGSTSADLTYSATTGSPNEYSIDFDGAAETAGFTDVVDTALPASPIVIAVPGTAATGTYNATLTVRNSATGCVSNTSAISVTINPVPTITLGANPGVCSGSTSANLPYSATTGSPNQYSINFDGPAETAGFADVVNATLPLSPIVITVPGTAAPGTYNATFTVRNSTTGCVSSSSSISVTINPMPTITLGPNPAVCEGITSADLTYSATTAGPDQYSVDFDAAAETAGFADVTNTVLPPSPIAITVPGTATPATYNATFTVRNSTTGCVSTTSPITITINPIPAGFNDAIQLCSDDAVSYDLQNNIDTPPGNGVADVTFSWIAAENTNVSGESTTAQAGGIISDVLVNTTGADEVVVYTVTPTGPGNCTGSDFTVSVTLHVTPAITLGANPIVCFGTTSADLTYSATTNSPDQYRIDFDETAETAGFADVPNTILPATPVTITVPGAAVAGTYNAIFYVIISATGCETGNAISVTINPAAVVDAGPPQTICAGSFGILSGSRSGGATRSMWTTSGDGTFNNAFLLKARYTPGLNDMDEGSVKLYLTSNDPSGPCPAARDSVMIAVVDGPDLELAVGVTESQICSGAASAVTVDGSEAGVSYQLRNDADDSLVGDPADGNGGTLTLPTGPLTASTTFNVLATGTCSAELYETATVTIRSSGDPLCGGTGTCATVAITPKPSPATCTNSDGAVIFSIKPSTPEINTTGVRIDIQGISSTNQTISRTHYNDSVFNGLPMGVYDYTVEYGDPSCIKTGQVTIDQSGTVGTPSVSNMVGPQCFGTTTVSVTLDVPGETGNVLEWSLDAGITDPFKRFTAGSQISGIPVGPAPAFEHVISVRRNDSDPCYAFVRVIVPESLQNISAPLKSGIGEVGASHSDAPTGKLQIEGSGGVSPYMVRIELDSASSFDLTFFETDFEEVRLNRNQRFGMVYENIPAGRYRVEVMDFLGCSVQFVARIPLDHNLFIPNVFTPNGDGSNDIFFIRNLPMEPSENHLIISNRWGKEVFISENYQNNWDGEGAADGLYYYRLRMKDRETITGWIEIMRGQKP